MSIETMFIRIPLRATLFTKRSRAMLINLQQLRRCELENKQIQFFLGDRNVFGEVPVLMRYGTHEEAQQRFTMIEALVLNEPQKQERLDMASPDSLAIAALDEYEEQKQLK